MEQRQLGPGGEGAPLGERFPAPCAYRPGRRRSCRGSAAIRRPTRRGHGPAPRRRAAAPCGPAAAAPRAVQAPNTPAPTTIDFGAAGGRDAPARPAAATAAAAAPALIADRRVIPAIHPSGTPQHSGDGQSGIPPLVKRGAAPLYRFCNSVAAFSALGGGLRLDLRAGAQRLLHCHNEGERKMARLWNRNGVGKTVFLAGASFAACLAAASPAYAQDRGRAGRPGRGRPRTDDETISSPRPSARRPCSTCPSRSTPRPRRTSSGSARHDRGSVAQRRRPHRPESRPGPEPGLDPRRLRRPDHPRPAGRQGAGRRLSRRIGDLAVAVHSRTSTCSTSTASRRCAARRAPCSAPARSAAPSATSPTSRRSTRSKAWSRATSTSSTATISAATSRARSTCPLGDMRGDPRRSAITPNMPASSTPCAKAAASTRTSTTAAAPAAASRLLFQPTREHLDHAAPRLPGGPRRRLQPAGGLQPLRQPVHHDPAAR